MPGFRARLPLAALIACPGAAPRRLVVLSHVGAAEFQLPTEPRPPEIGTNA